MLVKAYLILKVIDNKNIKVISGARDVPTRELQESSYVEHQLSSWLKSEFNLMYSWLDIKHVNTKILRQHSEPHLGIFYSSFVPKEFIDENIISYIEDFSTIDSEIQQEIQSSLRLPAY